MKHKVLWAMLASLVALILLIFFITTVCIDPWAKKKLESMLNEKNIDYLFKIEKVRILIFSPGIELMDIRVSKKNAVSCNQALNLNIASAVIKGLNPLKAIFKKEIHIREVSVFGGLIQGKANLSGIKSELVSPVEINIGSVIIDNIDVSLSDSSSSESVTLKGGTLKVFNLTIDEHDTITRGILKDIDFEAEQLILVTSDSMYSFKAAGITSSSCSKTLTADTLIVHPNYRSYDFTSRYKFQKNRIEALISGFSVFGFDAGYCLATGDIVSSYTEIGDMELNVFRDKRKEFHHTRKPLFQDIIQNYPGILHIDSLKIKNGDIIYTEHSEGANEPGSLSFDRINAKVYMIANDMVQNTGNSMLKLNAEALLMKKGKLSVILKVKSDDPDKVFTLDGTLGEMEVRELNPFIEKTASIYVTSGHIDNMKFSFKADNHVSNGNISIAYKGLKIKVKNRHTEDTTALKERLLSFIVNFKIIDSNPIPGEDLRQGKIQYERDPEKFLLSYCAKSIMSGIRSSLTRDSKKD